ncbi:CRIB domain-containing protein RIC4 [Lactuca sativa]|uniref:CRIB domain-containing protein RIC4 n=1 Tax=Lactuca sativa TaxID=4236 RepID=UPI000CAECED6|nr:CRIB domain-containing protein RIC4 [Lactuca sativa]
MRDIIERFLVLPFSMGCIPKSSTQAVESTQFKEQTPESKQLVTRTREGKSSWGFVAIKGSNISRGIRRLIMSTFESFSRIISNKEGDEIEMEIELEIGFPTDVKHVTHIGYDGSMTTNPVKNWEKIETPEILSFPCISLKQFENAMAAQSETLVA